MTSNILQTTCMAVCIHNTDPNPTLPYYYDYYNSLIDVLQFQQGDWHLDYQLVLNFLHMHKISVLWSEIFCSFTF